MLNLHVKLVYKHMTAESTNCMVLTYVRAGLASVGGGGDLCSALQTADWEAVAVVQSRGAAQCDAAIVSVWDLSLRAAYRIL